MLAFDEVIVGIAVAQLKPLKRSMMLYKQVCKKNFLVEKEKTGASCKLSYNFIQSDKSSSVGDGRSQDGAWAPHLEGNTGLKNYS